MRGTTLKVQQTVEFHVEECCNCGVVFAMTIEFYRARQKEKEEGSFYCPNGHGQHYMGKSDEQRRKEAERQRAASDAALQAERDQRLAAERELKRSKQRAKGGACPCCNRTFVQLARHIKTQHPDFERVVDA